MPTQLYLNDPSSRAQHGSACAQFRAERLGTTLPPGSRC